MASSIAFNDGVAGILSNGRPVPADRFWAWTPASRVVGPDDTILGTQRVVKFAFATVKGASFEIRDIPFASQDVADRLKLHLESGGSCTVTVGDGTHGPYTASLMPGTTVEIRTQDERAQTLTVALTLMNTTLGAPMLCAYPR